MLPAAMDARVSVPRGAPPASPTHLRPQCTCSPRQALFAKCKRRAGTGPDLCIVCMKQDWISGVGGGGHGHVPAACPRKRLVWVPWGGPNSKDSSSPHSRGPNPEMRRFPAGRATGEPVLCSSPAPAGCRTSSVSPGVDVLPQSLPMSSHRRPRGEPGCTFPCFVGLPSPTAWRSLWGHHFSRLYKHPTCTHTVPR